MNKKTGIGIFLVLLATGLGFYFIDKNSKQKKDVVITESISTYGNSVNNPVAINKANPGNIRDSLEVFQGEVPSPDSDFKSFASMAYGFRAMIVILRTYYTKHDLKNLAQMISRWAPPEENDTDSYIDFIKQNAPIDPEKDLQLVLFGGYNDELKNILTCMTWIEQGINFAVNEQDILNGYELA
jgi:hypothetical protein